MSESVENTTIETSNSQFTEKKESIPCEVDLDDMSIFITMVQTHT